MVGYPSRVLPPGIRSRFVNDDSVQRYREAQEQIAQWLGAGQVQYRENVVDGLENAPEAFIGLFRGENLGKQLVRVAQA
jgi:NADPH:quinone reductase